MRREGANVRAVVVYYSKTGFTQQYAKWLAEALDCECVPYAKRAQVRAGDYDVVIFGSWLRAGIIQKLDWIKKLPEMNGRKKIVFVTGAMPAEAEDAIQKVFEKNFTQKQRASIQPFYFPGGLDYDRMDVISRTAMRMLCRMLRGKKSRSREDEAMLRMIEKSFDGTKWSAIDAVVKVVKGEH